MNKFLLGITLTAIGAVALSSCTNELNEPGNMQPGLATGLRLAKDPQVTAWSGNQNLGNPVVGTRDQDVNANEWDGWNCINNVDEDLTEEDIANIVEMFKIGHEVYNTVVLPWPNYFVQQVYTGTDEYYQSDRCEIPNFNGTGTPSCGGNNTCNHLTSGDHTVTTSDKILGSNKMNHLYGYNSNNSEESKYEHFNNFNAGSNINKDGDSEGGQCNNGKNHKGTTFMKNMGIEDLTPTIQFGFDESYGTSPNMYNNYLILQYKGYWFIGFDYEMHKNNADTHNHGEALEVIRDYNFTDWIVRITPGYHVDGEGNPLEFPALPRGIPVVPDPKAPENPGDQQGAGGSNCEECGHPNTGDNIHSPGRGCKECDIEDKGCKSEGTDGGTQTTPGVSSQHQNEVEVNLAVNDEHLDKNGEGINDLVAKLSIHVRHAGDVEIFIPVSPDYYCDNDDLVILKDHSAGNFVHGGSPVKDDDGNITSRSVTYTIAGQDVTLTVIYETGGIRIRTSGINEDVIEYLQEEFGDGINFEVMLYFNDSDEFDRKKLFEVLDKATIEFLDGNLPDEFINAFGKEEEKDCTVSIVEDQGRNYEDAVVGSHLNGSDKNMIYKKKKETGGGE